jgi:ribulose-phosphate 3-epimerase
MIDVIPAVLSQNYEDLKNKIALVRGLVPVVQIDLCDGIFVPNKTWPFSTGGGDDINFRAILNEEEGMPFWEDIDFELDMMVADAVSNFDIYTKLSPKRIVFHLEAVGGLEEFKHFLEGMDVYIRDAIEIGLAINIETPVGQIFSFVNHVDFVQCMGIEKIGFQGQDFDERVLIQIKTLKEKFPDLIISVDGGVNLKTAPALVNAGVSRLVAGSLILKSQNIRETISELENLG